MVIDIDSFLEKYNEEDAANKLKEEEDKPERVDLSFQKDVEDSIHDVVERAKDADFQFLEQIYNEVKRFGEDLPNKFLGIGSEGVGALKGLGNKYSGEFLDKVRKNVQSVGALANQKLAELDSLLMTDEFSKIVSVFAELVKYYNLFPREFIVDKIALGKNLREREIRINEKLFSYKNKELIRIKKDIHGEILKLNSSLKPGNAREIEEKIANIHYLINSIPKLFLTELTNEKVFVSKMLIKAEEFLREDYKKEFAVKTKILHKLFEKFHHNIVNKDLKASLISYDEIILEFKGMPDVFLEEKIKIYNQINELYSSMNNLIVTDGVSTFLKSYAYSKVLDEARDYLRVVSMTKKISTSILIKLKDKLDDIPSGVSSEKDGLLNKVNQLLGYVEKSGVNLKDVSIEKNISEGLGKSPYSNFNMDRKEKLPPVNIDIKPELDRIQQIVKEEKKDEEEGKDVGFEYMNENTLKEINHYYDRLKKSTDPKELKVLYKKLNFYVSTLPLGEKFKTDMLQKIRRTISMKKLT